MSRLMSGIGRPKMGLPKVKTRKSNLGYSIKALNSRMRRLTKPRLKK